MAEDLRLIGYGPSVYTRIVRMALIELDLSASYSEVDPFSEPADPALAQYAPLGRVPVLVQGDFVLTETSAILRYLDRLSAKPSLVPQDARAAAQMAQVIGIVDFYGYVPMVRDVFAHGFFLAQTGEQAQPARVTRGLVAAQPILQSLENIAQEGLVLGDAPYSLADVHLAPMMDYFTKVPAAGRALSKFDTLNRWWQSTAQRPSLLATDALAQH